MSEQGIEKLISKTIKNTEALIREQKEGPAIETGYWHLDEKLSGLAKGTLTVIACRPGEGKTVLTANIVRHVAVDQRKPTVVFATEQTTDKYTMMLLCQGCINQDWVRAGFLAKEVMHKVSLAAEVFRGAPLEIMGYPRFCVEHLCRVVKRKKQARNSPALVAIDGINGLVSSRHEEFPRRMDELWEIGSQLKRLAHDADVPIIVTLGINRGFQVSDNERNLALTDMRDFGALEDFSDTVILLEPDRNQDNNIPPYTLMKARIAKQRNGPTGEVSLWFNKAFSRFESVVYKEAATEADMEAYSADGDVPIEDNPCDE